LEWKGDGSVAAVLLDPTPYTPHRALSTPNHESLTLNPEDLWFMGWGSGCRVYTPWSREETGAWQISPILQAHGSTLRGIPPTYTPYDRGHTPWSREATAAWQTSRGGSSWSSSACTLISHNVSMKWVFEVNSPTKSSTYRVLLLIKIIRLGVGGICLGVERRRQCGRLPVMVQQ
jgi:hypothetical protein